MLELSLNPKNGTPTEQQAKERFEAIIAKHDISPYLFTTTVEFEDKVIPHSHPVLTLNTFPYTDENVVLEAFIHEQLHWYLETEAVAEKVTAAVTELREKYPHAPWGFPLGCIDLDSTYLHLVLCYLANEIMKQLAGVDTAKMVLHYLQNHHYVWVYRTIESDSEYISSLIEKFGLTP